MNRTGHAVVWLLIAGVGIGQRWAWSEEPAKEPPPSAAAAPAKSGLGDPPGATRLSPQHDVWIESQTARRIVGAVNPERIPLPWLQARHVSMPYERRLLP